MDPLLEIAFLHALIADLRREVRRMQERLDWQEKRIAERARHDGAFLGIE